MALALDAISTRSSERTDYLDGWRGVAIFLVLEAHFIGFLSGLVDRLGVDLFFALSGFLMSGVLFIQRQPLRTFYKRRISRIAPAFLAFVISIYLFAFFKGLSFTQTEFVSTLLFLRTYFPDHTRIWASPIPIGHLWSLNIEEHCYIFMTTLVMIKAMRGREGIALVISGLICIVIGVLYLRLGAKAPMWGELGTEVAASHLLLSAGYRLFSDRVRPWIPPWLPIITLLAALACYLSFTPWWGSRVLSPFLMAFTVNHLPESSKWFKQLLATTVLKSLGIWSFSIYLWQQPFYAYKASFPGGWATALSCALVTGLLSFYILEQPCRSWLNRKW
jgi:peptidoglycan/LPS O-acetylase OafA/YrhL